MTDPYPRHLYTAPDHFAGDPSAADTTTFDVGAAFPGEMTGGVAEDVRSYSDWGGGGLLDGVEPRSYVITRGRTRPDHELDMLSVVVTTSSGAQERFTPPYDQLVELCGAPLSVAEVSAQMGLPLTVTKILLSDLLELDAVVARLPVFDDPKVHVLERVLDGLRSFTA